MYLSKPEEGFSIPVIYVSINELSINELKNIDTKRKEVKVKNDIKVNYLNEHESCRHEKENKDKLIFDIEDNINEEIIDDTKTNRKNIPEEAQSNGQLILDGDIVEEDK